MKSSEFEIAVDEMKNSLGILVRRLRSEAPYEHRELSWTQRSVMARLEKEGPMTSADLARSEGVKPQSMGTAIAHLEDLGFIKKKSHESDRRQLVITLTIKGAAMRKNGHDASRAWLSQAISKLEKKHQNILFEAVDILKRLAEL